MNQFDFVNSLDKSISASIEKEYYLIFHKNMWTTPIISQEVEKDWIWLPQAESREKIGAISTNSTLRGASREIQVKVQTWIFHRGIHSDRFLKPI